MNTLICCLALALTTIAAQAQAAALWGTDATGGLTHLTGSRTNASGVTATEDWNEPNGFEISWDISYDNVAMLWNYEYSVDVKRKGISHFLLEMTSDVTNADIFSNVDELVTPATVYTSTSNGNSNPLMPNPLFGVKFDIGATSYTYNLTTNRAPVWGNFYMKDGKSGGDDVVAWNTGLGFADYETNMDLTMNDFIVRPNGATPPNVGVVPVPAAVWLLGSGLLGLLGLRRRG